MAHVCLDVLICCLLCRAFMEASSRVLSNRAPAQTIAGENGIREFVEVRGM
jgi:hypothetical protein